MKLLLIPLILGVITLIAGAMFLFAPHKMHQLNDYLNKRVFSDDSVFSHRVVLSIICIAVGLLLLILYASYAFKM